MKWIKKGLIFNPLDHELHIESVGFAQSPQAIVLDDRIRIYFSTRTIDSVGKYLSHVAFVDFDRRMKNILAVSNHEVIPLGNLGCFDEHGIFPISPFKENDRIISYTTGWNRKVSVSADAAIGFAISEDNGLTYKKHGEGPIMASSLNEPFLVGDAFVSKYDEMYHMWYIYGQRWIRNSENEELDRVYKIAHAVSTDAINWVRNGKQIVSDVIDSNECQALPTIIKIDEMYHMYFCYRSAHGFRKNKEKSYRIGYAFSKDLTTWTRDDSLSGIVRSDDGWDAEMQCYPNVFECDGNVYMLYNGNEFGRHGFGLAVLDKR